MVSTLPFKFSLEILLFVLVCLHIRVQHHILDYVEYNGLYTKIFNIL